MEDSLWHDYNGSKPYRVILPDVMHPLQYYKIRLFLLSRGWVEFEEWMIKLPGIDGGSYEVWFSSKALAVLFKVSYYEA